jgi:hypothetical protein
MWLLHATELRLQQFSPHDVPKYAILSHRWEQEEVTFQDVKNETFSHLKGFSKLQGCCGKAAGDGYSWVWIDTCCINKTSSAELSEAINSMYRWYHDSAVCYAYLSDIQEIEDMKDLSQSKWFSRGWTLQELVAPRSIILFDGQWRVIGTKHFLAEQISSITSIPKNTLLGTSPFRCNVAQRMSWASTRQTTREEDMAYCLMGLFDVHMLPIYGEGLEKAFLRLQEEILKRSSDQTLFLWPPSNEPYNQGLLATSPWAFCTHYDCFPWLTAVGKIPRKGFSPYSLFRPSMFAPSSQTYDERSLGNYFGEDPNHAPSLVSLGPRGLQISLLLDVDKVALSSKIQNQRPRTISLDVFVVFERYHMKIALLLVPDVRMDYTSMFFPYRLGEMRREVCIEPGSNPQLNVQLSFKRSTLTISQIRNAGPGNPVKFVCRNSRSEALAGEVKIFEPEAFVDTISDVRERSICCSGGSIEVKHSCPDCSVQGKLVLFFGTRGQPSQTWCTLSIIPSSVSIKDFYGNTKLLSTRLYERSSIGIPCGQVLLVKIQPSVDENLYSIAMDIQDTMEIVSTYGLEEEKL